MQEPTCNPKTVFLKTEAGREAVQIVCRFSFIFIVFGRLRSLAVHRGASALVHTEDVWSKEPPQGNPKEPTSAAHIYPSFRAKLIGLGW